MTFEERRKIRKLERDIRLMQKENRRIFGEEERSPVKEFFLRFVGKLRKKQP